MLQAFSVNSTPLGQTNSLPRASSKASVWSAKLKMSVVLCCNVAFHLPAVCSLSVTKSCSMRKHHIYWADNPSVLKGLSSCHNRAALLLFHQFRFTNVCCRNNPRGGKDSTQKKDVKKKLCLVSSEPKVLVRSMKVVKRKLLRHLCDLKGN